MTEYLETKYASKVKIVQLRKPQREWYKVHVICEFDDESEEDEEEEEKINPAFASLKDLL